MSDLERAAQICDRAAEKYNTVPINVTGVNVARELATQIRELKAAREIED